MTTGTPHECSQKGVPVLVVYEGLRGGGTKTFYACAYCDGCAKWPNWLRGLKDRAEKEGE